MQTCQLGSHNTTHFQTNRKALYTIPLPACTHPLNPMASFFLYKTKEIPSCFAWLCKHFHFAIQPYRHEVTDEKRRGCGWRGVFRIALCPSGHDNTLNQPRRRFETTELRQLEIIRRFRFFCRLLPCRLGFKCLVPSVMGHKLVGPMCNVRMPNPLAVGNRKE